ncbi:MAG: 3-isopropylmalate dehydratase large subunit, partial [Alphaproteobacteria bacterium]|nr:3-isopropylmalate dehydratase large subunit [Alphaproteobacteria bacterium]
MSLAGAPQSIISKIWNHHVITQSPEGDCLLWIDRHFVHEGSNHGFGQVAARQRPVARPDLTFGVADHYVPTRARPASAGASDIIRMIETVSANTARHGISMFGPGHRNQGIVHVAMPELGLTLPGLTIVCGDSHTSTHGALGAYAFGIGASEVAHVLMTQTLWQRKPREMAITVDGILPAGITAKDIALHIIARLGAGGATSHAIEYRGSTIRDLSIEGRMTLCNLSIEAGSRLGLIGPDENTFAYLKGRANAPAGDDFERACDAWMQLNSSRDTHFDTEHFINAGDIAPSVTWGTS